MVKNKDKLTNSGAYVETFYEGKKLHLDIIPIDFATLFATNDISDFQFKFSSKITPRKFVSFTLTIF